LTTVYGRLADGTYEAVKDGTKTLILPSSITRRREGLPKAQYNVRKGVRGVPKRQAATA